VSTGRILANALLILLAFGALLLALFSGGCAGQTERDELADIHTCSPGVCPAEVPHCAALQSTLGHNECRPGCQSDSDCLPGARCVELTRSGPLVCERWLSKGYANPYD
jgi:hypothetical protein